MNELISVIIPTYNREKTLNECIDSILKQTYENIEIIVVDDASTDMTYQVMNDIHDDRVKYYRYKVNRGACYARNYGVDISTGSLIAFQDSDDKWLPDKLERQLNYMREHDADFVFCGMMRCSAKGSEYWPTYDFDDRKDAFEQLLLENSISTQTMLMKRIVIEEVRFDVTFRRFQDWDFALQVAMHGFRIAYLKEPLVISPIQSDSISTVVSHDEAFCHLYDKYKEYYNNRPSTLSDFYMKWARGFRSTDREKTTHYLMLSLKTKIKWKTLAKLILNFCGLWRE